MSSEIPEVDEAFEDVVGITEFANTAPGIQGIMKQRYSDFIVREVLVDNTVTYLNELSGAALEDRYFKVCEDAEESKDGQAEDVEQKATRMVATLVDVSKCTLTEEETEKLRGFIAGCLEKSDDCADSIALFPDLDKVTRTAVHTKVKSLLTEYVETETVQIEGKSLIKIIAKHKRAGTAGNKRKRAEWPQGLGNFLRFTLLKENIDTMNAVTILNNGLRCGNSGNGVTYSGTKDKRGVTMQKCTVYRRKPSDFNRLNASKMTPTILCGDFEFVNEPAQLGDGGGNRFEIVLRALNTSREEEILGACEAMQRSGFVNYFGLQRFGKGGTKSHEFGKAILKSDWESCVTMLFTPRDGDRPNIAASKQHFAAGNYADALRVMPEQMYAEKCVLQRLVNKPTDFMSAYAAIPKNARLICAHAYQSYLWNKATSRRLQLYGMSVVEGDLVLREQSSGVSVTAPEQNVASDGSGTAPVTFVTAEDVAAQRYTIGDVVLPIPGYESIYPSNAIGAYYDELLAADGLNRGSYDACHVTYREKGVYRRLIQAPKEFEWKAISYDDPDAELAETELSRFREMKGNKSVPATAASEGDTNVAPSCPITAKAPKYWALQVKFSLPPGTYATMLLRELTKSSTESQFQAQLSKESGSNA
jgi:tRNA pseudouridine13 synthase